MNPKDRSMVHELFGIATVALHMPPSCTLLSTRTALTEEEKIGIT